MGAAGPRAKPTPPKRGPALGTRVPTAESPHSWELTCARLSLQTGGEHVSGNTIIDCLHLWELDFHQEI